MEERNETKHDIRRVTPSSFEKQAKGMWSSFALNPTSQASLGRLEHFSVELRRQVSHGTVA